MFHALLERIRSEASGDRALASICEIVRFHRVQASPGYDAAAEWLTARLRALPIEVEVEYVPGDGRTRFLGHLMPEGWDCGAATADLVDASGASERVADYAQQKLSLVLRSAPARGRFPLVAIDGGDRPEDYDGRDVRGAVVLSRAPVHRVHTLAVIERGAAGILFDGRRLLPPVRTEEHDRDSLAYTSFWWVGDEPRGWGFVASPRRGQELRDRLAADEPLALDVAIETRRFTNPIPLVSARIPGDRAGEILVMSHLCHPEPSANDNASGVAATLEIARVLATLETARPVAGMRSVRFLWMPEFTGSFAWLGADPARAASVAAAINLDMVGQNQERCGSTLLIEHPPCFAASFAEELLVSIRRAALDWVTSYSGAGHYSLTRVAEVPYSGGSDHTAMVDPATGVPCPMLIQWPDRFYHSSLDTPDKSDPGSLALAVRCAATYAAFLARAGPAECEWLAQSLERTTRRRLLEDEAPGWIAIERERVRLDAALASLGRLGFVDPAARERREDWERFVEREIVAATPVVAAPNSGPGAARIPVRLQASALDGMQRRIEGYERLDAAEREAFAAFERTFAAADLLEVAWFACDGRRTVEEIARLVALETGRQEDAAIAGFFEWTARLGRSLWKPPEGE